MNLVNRAFQLQCVFRENKYMKKLLYTIVLLIAVLIIPAQPAHAQSHWYTKDPIIRHGGARIGNKNAKNTVSAFKNSAKKGYTVIEMDSAIHQMVCLSVTMIGKLVFKLISNSEK